MAAWLQRRLPWQLRNFYTLYGLINYFEVYINVGDLFVHAEVHWE